MSKGLANIIGISIMVISFWVCYGTGWYFMPDNPFSEWFGMPLMVTLVFTWMSSCYLATYVRDKLENKA